MAKTRKKKKDLIPKRIAGVKVPKGVRKGRFGQMLASQTGQAVIAQAILGAGAVAAGLKARDDPKVRRFAHDAKDKVAATANDAHRGATDAGATLAYALAEAARTFAEVLRRGERHPSMTPDQEAKVWTPDYGAPDPQDQSGAASRPG